MNQDRTRHYHSEEWADFVRGVTPEQQRPAMELHLATGCPECARTVNWLRRLTATAASPVEPPPELAARAKAIFGGPVAAPNPLGWFDSLEVLVAELVFSSSAGWLPSGVRSGGGSGERRVYKTNGYSVDLTKGEGVSFGEVGEIIGQISAEDPRVVLDRVVVQLRVAGKLLGETETNQFGEFVMQSPASAAATLHFALPRQGKRIDVRLRNQEDNRKK